MLICTSLSITNTISCNSRENEKKNTNVIKLTYTYKYWIGLSRIKLESYKTKVLVRVNIVGMDIPSKVICQVFQ